MPHGALSLANAQISRRHRLCASGPTVHLFEDSRRDPVPQLPPGYSVYRRPRMAEEGVPANAELV